MNDLPVELRIKSTVQLRGFSGDPRICCFVALDFETADSGRDSACALGLVKVSPDGKIDRLYHLIRPPRKYIPFTWVHGISWAHVANKPTFGELWPEFERFIVGADFLVAHNAAFDRGVLHACCALAGMKAPELPFFCSVQLAKRTWNFARNNLPSLSQYLGFSLQHHNAASDAEACAMIVLAAARHRGELEMPWVPVGSPKAKRSPRSRNGGAS